MFIISLAPRNIPDSDIVRHVLTEQNIDYRKRLSGKSILSLTFLTAPASSGTYLLSLSIRAVPSR
ncbi:hypothetical protein PCURB6_06680 [Paenibacillus curdlanolyticus]|nr:hypothetical protein PCURB6_06680 [Paenibacillus curdlanolyticus]